MGKEWLRPADWKICICCQFELLHQKPRPGMRSLCAVFLYLMQLPEAGEIAQQRGFRETCRHLSLKQCFFPLPEILC